MGTRILRVWEARIGRMGVGVGVGIERRMTRWTGEGNRVRRS